MQRKKNTALETCRKGGDNRYNAKQDFKQFKFSVCKNFGCDMSRIRDNRKRAFCGVFYLQTFGARIYSS